MGMLTDMHMYNQWIHLYFIENKRKQSKKPRIAKAILRKKNSLNFLHLWPSLPDTE